MDTIFAHIDSARTHIQQGYTVLGTSATDRVYTDPTLGPNSDLPHYDPGVNLPLEARVGPNTDIPHYSPPPVSAPEGVSDDGVGPSDGSSFGFDHTVREEVIAEFGELDHGVDIDRVGLYEFDLGQFSDSVHSVDLSAVPGNAELNFLGYDANGAAIVSVGEDGVILTLEGEASAYLANLEWEGGVGPLGVTVEALVGASASASGDLIINPMEGDFNVEVQAGVVVGATIDANGELELGHVTIEGGATGVAGFAAEVQLDVGFEDWEFEFDAGGKLAFLLGGGVDVSFSLDGKEIVADLGDAGKVVWNESGEIIGGVINAGGEVVEFAADGFEWAAGGLQTIGGGISNGVDTLTPWDGWLPG